jgi:hypothetical protein
LAESFSCLLFDDNALFCLQIWFTEIKVQTERPQSGGAESQSTPKMVGGKKKKTEEIFKVPFLNREEFLRINSDERIGKNRIKKIRSLAGYEISLADCERRAGRRFRVSIIDGRRL